MKVNKIYQMILKDHAKDKKLVYGKYHDYLDDEDYVFVTEGRVGWLIKEKEFPFDLSKLMGDKSMVNVERLFTKNDTFVEGSFTGELKLCFEGKKTFNAMKFIAENGSHAWFDERLLENFECYHLMITHQCGIANVYEGEQLVGAILPVRMAEK